MRKAVLKRPLICIIDPSSFVLPFDAALSLGFVENSCNVKLVASDTKYNGEIFKYLLRFWSESISIASFSVSSSVNRCLVSASLNYIKLLVYCLRRMNEVDLFLFNFGSILLVDLVALSLMGNKCCLVVHNAVPHDFSGSSHIPTFLRAKVASGLIFLSQSQKDEFFARYPSLSGKRSYLLQHGILPAMWPCAAVINSEHSASVPIATVVGNVKPYKGIGLLSKCVTEGVVQDLQVYGKWDRDLTTVKHDMMARGALISDEFIAPEFLDRLLRERRVFILAHDKETQSGLFYLLLHYAKPFICSSGGDTAAFAVKMGRQELIIKDRKPDSVGDALAYALRHYDVISSELAEKREDFQWKHCVGRSGLLGLVGPTSVI